MIGVKKLTDKVNALITAGGLTDLQILQLSAIKGSLDNSKYVVDSAGVLPDATANEGRLVYVVDSADFYFAQEGQWTNIFNSNLTTIFVNNFSWGYNTSGELGIGLGSFSNDRSSPVTVIGGITNWSQVAAGGTHSLGLTSGGILYAWGNNNLGQLGDNARSTWPWRSSPVTVVGGITSWSQVAAGGAHTLGLTAAGVIYAWGNNASGHLGDNTAINRSSPVTVVGGITNWSQISAGSRHSAGLTDTGIIYAWGSNASGQLGDNTTVNKSSPVTVVGGITNWSQVSASTGAANDNTYIIAGVTDTGDLYTWGNNYWGHLGDHTTAPRSSPGTVVGGITNWSQVSAAKAHCLGLTDSGILYGWGSGSLTGADTSLRVSSPTTVVGGITNWSQISAGGGHSLALTDTGILYAWGANDRGRLGDNTAVTKSSPVTVVGGITDWSQVSTGNIHSLALQPVTAGFN